MLELAQRTRLEPAPFRRALRVVQLLRGHLEALARNRFGRILISFGALLGVFGALLGALLGVFGALLGVFGAMLGVLGSLR